MRKDSTLKVLPDKPKAAPKPLAPKAPPVPKPPAVHTLDSRVGGGGAYKIALAGAGGSGSRMVSRLAEMALVMREMGLGRLDVDVYDPDRASPSNAGRGGFYPQEAGQYKASALVHRANCGFGVSWQAMTERYIGQHYVSAMGHHRMEGAYDVLITCVDTGAARREIFERIAADPLAPIYWLDLGNDRDTGQVLLGQVSGLAHAAKTRLPRRLPCVVEKWPGYFDGSIPESDTPSCSVAEALEKQSLFINAHMALWAGEILTALLLKKRVEVVGCMVNLKSGHVNPLRVETVAA